MDTHASMTNLPDSAEAQAHAPHGEEHAHPTWSTYWKVALILTLITVGEVWSYYIPSFVAGRGFVPTLLVLSGLKFAIDVKRGLQPKDALLVDIAALYWHFVDVVWIVIFTLVYLLK